MDTIIQTHRRTMGQIHSELTRLQRKVEELEEENKKLKDENEKLEGDLDETAEEAQDSFQAIADALCGEGDEADSIAGWGHHDKIVKRIKDLTSLQSKVEELKQENEELKEQCIELKDDNEELIDKDKGWTQLMKEAIDSGLVGKVEKLKEENKDLKVENELNMDLVRVAGEAVEKLEAENKKLKEHYDKTMSVEHGWGNAIMAEMYETKDLENEKLEEELLYYRMYVYSIDPGADCSPEKEHVDSFTDDPQQRKILYERIGYESDDESDEDYED